jgi:hypothetical protein
LAGTGFGIEFAGGNAFQVPATVGTLAEAEEAVANAGATVVSGQEVGGGDPQYMIRTLELDSAATAAIRGDVAAQFGISPAEISDDRVSAAWGGQITRQALIALSVFLALVVIYLIVRFEPLIALACVVGVVIDLVVTAGAKQVIPTEWDGTVRDLGPGVPVAPWAPRATPTRSAPRSCSTAVVTSNVACRSGHFADDPLVAGAAHSPGGQCRSVSVVGMALDDFGTEGGQVEEGEVMVFVESHYWIPEGAEQAGWEAEPSGLRATQFHRPLRCTQARSAPTQERSAG